MRKLYLGMAVLAFGLLPAAASAQQVPQRQRHEAFRQPYVTVFVNPADVILQRRAQLGLTANQMARLTRIRDHFRRENATDLARARRDMERVRAQVGPPPYSPQAMDRIRTERRDMEKRYPKMLKNMRAARNEALQVLTPAQRQMLMRRGVRVPPR